jgi:hypothetical protein
MTHKLLFVSVLAVGTLVACGGKKDEPAGGAASGGGGGTAGGGGGGGGKAPVAPAFLKVEKLGVQLEVPGDAKAEPGAGDSFMITSNSAPDCTVMLGKENPDAMESYDSLLKHIKEGTPGFGKLKAMKKEEKGADGSYKLEYESEDDMEPGKSVYGVDYRVAVDGALYGCARRTDTAEGAACVAKACASLKKI